MSWGNVVVAGAGLIGGAMSSDSGGGGGASQSQSREPWAPAQPWLLSNIVQGMGLQNQYAAQPFSPKQQAAYDNSYALSDYTRGLVPSLLNQMQGQPVGFDPSNPTAKQKAWDWNALADGALGQRSVANATAAPAPAPAQSSLGDFIQQNGVLSGATQTSWDGTTMLGTGGYGSFKYGMATPKPGTQAYRDMSEYFAMGGTDPNGYYGATGSKPYIDPNVNPYAHLWTSGGGNGTPAGGGIGDTGANAAAAASGNTAW